MILSDIIYNEHFSLFWKYKFEFINSFWYIFFLISYRYVNVYAFMKNISVQKWYKKNKKNTKY